MSFSVRSVVVGAVAVFLSGASVAAGVVAPAYARGVTALLLAGCMAGATRLAVATVHLEGIHFEIFLDIRDLVADLFGGRVDGGDETVLLEDLELACRLQRAGGTVRVGPGIATRETTLT
ncbi:hypothetical protein BRC97_12825 [Halobacteriales archaeon QS_6_71_20]|nr:MAG: hypothetical protein BRC97_12825 [Halobacteriales archaeon QS_6_71_20]